MMEMNRGSAWIPHPEKVWISGDIQREENDHVIVLSEDGNEVKIPKSELQMQNPPIQDAIDDMTSLSHLHEPAVIYNLTSRYDLNTIYTYTGTILIAINPYTQLPIYTKEMIDSFCDQPVTKLPPHVYAIAEASYREMLTNQNNQSILVTGESGSGKTESTKFLLQYFAAMGGRRGQSVQETLDNNNIESQVIKSTPILEAFGNAKTLRNDNSSRFGKFISIHFDKLKGTIIGANLETYLLEKSRIVKPPTNERSYHIFYQFLAGIDQESKQSLMLGAVGDFEYLRSSGCHTIDQVDDKQVFEKTKQALCVVGFTDDDLMGVWKVLAAILHCGNIQFQDGKEENSSELKSDIKLESMSSQSYDPLEQVCKLLDISMDKLKSTLLSRTIKAGNESYTIPMTVQQANEAKDSLAMFLYSRLFDWIVKRINNSIDKNNTDYSFIGILDIYGFESFESNSFEQFTINYANEKLQNQFNHQIFKLEQQEYNKEKIDWSNIEFNDNQECIDLIEKKPLGILSILDEESQFPKATPNTLCSKLYSNHTGKSKHFEKPRFSNVHFTIDHYAGKVDYDTTMFLEKNKDFIIAEQVMALQSSGWEFFKNLLNSLSSGTNKSSSSSSSSSFKFLSVSTQFKESLNKLMTTINSTNPHYIRCIKPNTIKKANHFDKSMVLQQLRCGGVIEQLKISRSGYPGRLPYDMFLKRYRLLAAKELIGMDIGNDPRKGSEILIEKLKIDINNAQFGLTKIFFRSGIISNLELLRVEQISRSAIVIQKCWKAHLVQKWYNSLKQSSVILQTYCRSTLASNHVEMLLQEESAICLQSYIRSTLDTMSYRDTITSTLCLQCALRSSVKHEMSRLYNGVAKCKALWRGKQARAILRQLKLEAKSLSHMAEEKKKLELKQLEINTRLQEEKETKDKLENEKNKLEGEKQQLEQSKMSLSEQLEKSKQEYQTLQQESQEEISDLKKTITELNQRLLEKETPFSPTSSRDKPTGMPIATSMEYPNGKPQTAAASSSSNDSSTFDEESYVNIDLESPETQNRKLEQSKNHLHKELLLLREREHGHQLEIEELNRKVMELREQLEKERSTPRSQSPPTTSLSGSSASIMSHLPPPPLKPISATNSGDQSGSSSPNQQPQPRDQLIKSLSYVDFNQSPSTAATATNQLPNQGLSKSTSIRKDIIVNSIPNLITALEFNNNKEIAGRYLVDQLVQSSFDMKFVGDSGMPEPCFIVCRCFINDAVSNHSNGKTAAIAMEILNYFVESINKLIMREWQNMEFQTYWLSNVSLMLNILENVYRQQRLQSPKESSVNGNNSLSNQQSMSILQLKTHLQNVLIKIYNNIVRTILDFIQPIFHRSLNDSSVDVDIMEPLTNYLTRIHNTMDKCNVYDHIKSVLFIQIFKYINSLLFNEIVLRKDLCCLRSSIRLKMNISELEYWAKSYDTHYGWCAKAIGQLAQIRETIFVLMIDKSMLLGKDIRNEVCPNITAAQLKQILTMYTPDLDSFEDAIPHDVITQLMESADYNRSENILLDLSNIFALPLDNLHQITFNEMVSTNYSCDHLVSRIIQKNIDYTTNYITK